jgi:hypothetical protein
MFYTAAGDIIQVCFAGFYPDVKKMHQLLQILLKTAD